MALVKQGVLVLAFILVYYLGLVGLTELAFPDRPNGNVDVLNANNTLYETDPKMGVYDIAPLRHFGSEPRIVLVGASNVRLGLRPAQISPLLAGIKVDNVAVGASNIRPIAQLVDHIYDQIPTASQKNIVFVIGIYLGTFESDARAWPDGLSSIDTEMLRYGLYARTSSGTYSPVVSQKMLPTAITMVKPFMLVTHLFHKFVALRMRAAGAWILELLGERKLAVVVRNDIPDPDTIVLTEDYKDQEIKFWNSAMGPRPEWNDKMFDGLVDLAHRVSARGSRLVVLDMPLPSWLTKGVPYFIWYQQHKIRPLEQIQSLDGVTYANLQGMLPDGDFYSAAHPRPKTTWKLASRVTDVLRPIVAEMK